MPNTTKEVKTRGGDRFIIRSADAALLSEASRNLKRDGVRVKASDSDLHENIDFQAEVVRLAIVEWEHAGELVKISPRPKEARQFLTEVPGLLNAVFNVARELADADASDMEIIAGN